MNDRDVAEPGRERDLAASALALVVLHDTPERISSLLVQGDGHRHDRRASRRMGHPQAAEVLSIVALCLWFAGTCGGFD
jgi:hypothetical protein